MKKLFLLPILLLGSTVSAGVGQNLVATCVRADSGDSPEIKVYSNKDKSYGLIMLNTYDGKEFFVENTQVTVRDAVDEYKGVDVSLTIPTQLETTTEKFDTDLTIHGDTENIEPWLKSYTNLSDPQLGHENVTVAFVCDQVN